MLFSAEGLLCMSKHPSSHTLHGRKGKEDIFHQTCRDIMVYPLYRHGGICNAVPLLILHNASDASMHLDREREGGGGL